MLSTAPGMFSLSQTGPADLTGSAWDATAEGTQNFHFSDHGDSLYAGYEDDMLHFGHITPKQDRLDGMDDLHSQWTDVAAIDSKDLKAEPMRRVTSKSSTGSHRHSRTMKPSKKTQTRAQSILSLTSSQLSNLDMTGNVSAAFRDGHLSHGRYMDQFLSQDLDTLSVSSHMAAQPYLSGPLGLNTDGLPYVPAEAGVVLDHHGNPQIFDSGLIVTSPHSWASLSPVESRRSSPDGHDGLPEDMWSTVPADTTPPESLGSNSPELSGQSPRMTRKVDGSHFVTSEDLHGNLIMPAVGEESFPMTSTFTARRLPGEGESARDHYLYKSAFPQADGLFHCPWEGQASCNHKPEKLKCNYDKFVDSHLKPYRCKVEGCQNARFSSTACLLRHEREAHAMHGHGEKPYLCTYDGCERSAPGHGFPRQWNLRDHMRRVHNDNGPAASASAAASPPPAASAPTSSGRGRKRKTETEKSASSGSHHQEKASSGRKSSSSKTSSSEKAAKSQRVRDVDDWHRHRQAVQSLVQGFGQPTDPEFWESYTDVQSHLTAMSRISSGLAGPDPRAGGSWKTTTG